MKTLKIAVGTTSDQKIQFLKEVLLDLKIKYKLFPIKAKSGVSEQPKTIKETKKGSINRAKDAFKKIPNAHCAVGIEIGYHKEKNSGYQMFCVVSILSENEVQISTESQKFLLPKFFQEILSRNIDLGQNLDGYLKQTKGKSHIHKHIDWVVRYRKPFIEGALRTAFIHFINKEEFSMQK